MVVVRKDPQTSLEQIGWPGGLIETQRGDSTRMKKTTLARAENVRFTLAGSVYQRKGLRIHGDGVPSSTSRLWEFQAGTKRAIIESDGDKIRVLTTSGWTEIGSFATSSSRASGCLVNTRLYLCNGASAMKVVNWNATTAAWDVRDAGVAAPTGTISLAAASGVATDSYSFRIAVTYVDDRGFESNYGTDVSINGVKSDDTITITSIPVGPSGTASRVIYASRRDERTMYWVQEISDNTTTSTTIDAYNGSRDLQAEAPSLYTEPPSSVYSLYYYRKRLFGAQQEGYPTYWEFTGDDNVEAWPSSNAFDMSDFDSSHVLGFAPVFAGMLIMKKDGVQLLENDPKYSAVPVSVMNGKGLLYPDGYVAVDGVCYILSQPGLIAHDGVKLTEIYNYIQQSSDEMIASGKIFGFATDKGAKLLWHDQDNPGYVNAINFEPVTGIYYADHYKLGVTTSVETVLRPMSTATNIYEYEDCNEDYRRDLRLLSTSPALLEGVAVGLSRDIDGSALDSAPSIGAFETSVSYPDARGTEPSSLFIKSGGGTTSIVLSDSVASKVVAGCAIRFDGSTTVYEVVTVSGASMTLSASAPANGTSVYYIRGCELASSRLKLTKTSGSYISTSSHSYYADILALDSSDFTSFIAFDLVPFEASGITPENTDIRFGVRFSTSDAFREFTGTDWSIIYGEPSLSNTYGMTLGEMNNLQSGDMIKAGGFNDASPYIEIRAYLMSSDSASTPELISVSTKYVSGTKPMVTALYLASDVTLDGDTLEVIPEGNYICNTNGLYRIDEDDKDADDDIECIAQLQNSTLGKGYSDVTAVEFGVESQNVGSQMTIELVIDDNVVGAHMQLLDQGFKKYSQNFTSWGANLSARFKWKDPGVTLCSAYIDAEERPVV